MEALAQTSVADAFLACLQQARHVTQPFYYWLLQKVLPDAEVDAIAGLPITPPQKTSFQGRRAANHASRVFFDARTQEQFPACKRIADGFKDERVIAALERETGAQLARTRLRVEYCQDTPGFWLEPHTDIAAKKLTMVVYLLGDPALRLAGTDIHEGPPDYRYVTTAPYARNLGLVFIPASDTWHGVGHHPLKSLRKSLIVNYVGPEWCDTFELA